MWAATVAYLMASMAKLVGSIPDNGVVSSCSAWSMMIRRVMVGVAKNEGPAPGVMNPRGPVPRVVKPRGYRPIGVEAGGADGVTTIVVAIGGDEPGGTMFVGLAPLGLAMMGELSGAEDRFSQPPELPGAVIRTCSRLMACSGISSYVDDAVMGLIQLSSPCSISESGMRLAEVALLSEM